MKCNTRQIGSVVLKLQTGSVTEGVVWVQVSGFDINKQNKEERGVPSCFCSECIAHLYSDAVMFVRLQPSVKVSCLVECCCAKKPQRNFLLLLPEKKQELNDKTEWKHESVRCLDFFFFTYWKSPLIVSKFTVHEGLNSESNVTKAGV